MAPAPLSLPEVFLAGADVVVAAVTAPEVGARWDEPSVLAEQTVGGLAGHVARAGVWIVAEYLPSIGAATELTFDSAAAYYVGMAEMFGEEQHAALRARNAAIGATGQDAVVEQLRDALDQMRGALAVSDEAATITVIGGTTLGFADYLRTRVLEQTVHLDDLARSIGHPGWPMPTASTAISLELGIEIGLRRSGGTAMLRALFGRGETDALPVF